MSPGWNGVEQSHQLLGLSLRAAAARRHDRGGARGAQRAVSRDPQRRRGAAAAGHERRDAWPSSGPSRSSSSPAAWARARRARRLEDAALPAARRHRLRAADRVRQYRQPAAGALGRARDRNGGAPVDRRRPVAVDRAAADRVAAARGVRRHRRHVRRAVDARADHVADAGAGRADDGVRRQPARDAVRRGRDDRHGPAVRPLPGAAQHAARIWSRR